MKSQLVLLLVLLLIACTKAPKKIFTTNGANRFTAQQIETKRLALQAQLAQQIRTDFLVKASIVDSFSSGDSLIKKIRFEVMNLEIEGPKSRAALTKQVGQSFPEVTLPTPTGEKVNFTAFRGKPSVVNFWFTRCAPCIDEIPVFNQMVKNHGTKYNFIAITFDKGERVQRFLAKGSFDFFHLTEAKAFIDSIELSAYPTTLLLDSEGVIKHVQGGLPYRFDKNGELGMGDGKDLIALLEEME